MNSTIEADILHKMSLRGINCKEDLIIDSKIHRFSPDGDKNKNGWYVFFDNGHLVAGQFGCWKRGISEKYCSKEIEQLTVKENKYYKEKLKHAQEELKKDEAEKIREKANNIWNHSATIDVDFVHLYLSKKKVLAHNIRSTSYEKIPSLAIPLRDNENIIQSLQFIFPDGQKRFLPGGPKKGNYHMLGQAESSDLLYIAEGYATAATIHEATNQCVVIAFDSGNLLSVAQNIRGKFSDKKIIIVADNDAFNDGNNVGVIKAREAAQETAAYMIVPEFKDTATKPTDFNDLQILEGLDEVKRQITTNCVEPPKKTIPGGFIVNDKGVFVVIEDKKFKTYQEIFICSRIDVIARTRDKEGNNHGLLLQFKDKDGRVHSWAMPMEILATDGAECRRNLLKMGLHIEPGGLAKEKLVEYLSKSFLRDTTLCVDCTGWYEGCFVFPDEVIGNSKENEQIIFQNMSHNREGFKTNGTLKDWQENVAKYCVGNSRLILAVSIAFAAPLLGLLGEESGGFHFTGSSSTGKTTALKIAGSGWGDRKRLQTWRTTSNGLEAVAAQHNDSLLIIDEMGQVDPKDAGEIAYMLANGNGKNRCKKDGTLQSKANWQLLFLSSGEIGLAEHVLQTGHRVKAGQQVRFLDIPADAGEGYGLFEDLHGFADGSEFARYFDQTTQSYYGATIREFLKKLTNPEIKKEVELKFKEFKEKFIKELNLVNDEDGQVKRAANRFALVAAAGELATYLDITAWKEWAVIAAMEKCFFAWLEKRGGCCSTEELQIIGQIKKFFQENYPSRFIPFNDKEEDFHRTIKKVGYISREEKKDDNLHFYVETEVFKEEVCRGLDNKLAVLICIKKGWLLPDENDERPTRSVYFPNTKKSRRLFYFNSVVLGSEHD